MTRTSDLALTALAPAIWGSTYFVTTQFLPQGYPITVAMLRALPAGLLLSLLVRQLPSGAWWAKVFVLGSVNFSIFWSLLFVAAYRLPGGVAATVGAVQPLLVIFLASAVLNAPVHLLSVVAGAAGLGGVALLVLSPAAALDPVGVAAGLGGAASMVSTLGFLSPATALLLGWAALGQRLEPVQIAGVLTVLASVWLAARAGRAPRLAAA